MKDFNQSKSNGEKEGANLAQVRLDLKASWFTEQTNKHRNHSFVLYRY